MSVAPIAFSAYVCGNGLVVENNHTSFATAGVYKTHGDIQRRL